MGVSVSNLKNMYFNNIQCILKMLLYIAMMYMGDFKKMKQKFLFFLFLFLFNVPVNNFSVMLRRSHLFLGITSTFGE